MPEIPISREQQAYIAALREELDDEVAYGHVREQDAVQYLIDHHREDGELDIEVSEVAADEEGDGDGGDGETTTEATDGGAVDASDSPAEGSNGSSGGSDATEAGGSIDASVEALGNAGPGGDADADAGADSESADAESAGGTIGSAGGDMVDEMMNLMDAHSDVWEESDSSDGKYRVELPDGSTESVPTKDDVRALLFKHYR